MAQSSYTTLAAFFETGDRPTASNFADLIETAVVGPAYSNQVTLTTATTLSVATHGLHPILVTGTTTVTLPGVAVGASFWIINGNADGTAITVAPNSSDMFLIDAAGAGGTNNKHITNTAGTAIKGDYVKLTYGSGDGWTIVELAGTWADES